MDQARWSSAVLERYVDAIVEWPAKERGGVLLGLVEHGILNLDQMMDVARSLVRYEYEVPFVLTDPVQRPTGRWVIDDLYGAVQRKGRRK